MPGYSTERGFHVCSESGGAGSITPFVLAKPLKHMTPSGMRPSDTKEAHASCPSNTMARSERLS